MLGGAFAAALTLDASAQIGLAGRITHPTDGTEADADVRQPALSSAGDMLAFSTAATTFGIAGNGRSQILVYDLFNDTVALASRTGAGMGGDGNSFAPSVSETGRYVAFESLSTNLSAEPQSGLMDVFRADLQTGAVVVVNVADGGAVPNSASRYPSISSTGRYVAFLSSASNLLPAGQDTNGRDDVFVRDFTGNTTERVSVGAGGAQLSQDSLALSPQSISADGRRVVFANGEALDGANAGNTSDIYLRDRTAGTTTLISKSSAGVAANSSSDQAAISPDGRFVAFRSFATNLTPGGQISRVFVRDRQATTTTQVPLPAGAASCSDPRVADTGDVVMTCAMSGSGVQAQQFLYRPAGSGLMFRLSEAMTVGNGNAASGPGASINAEGTIIAFESAASNLVADDNNGFTDVFIAVDEEALDQVFSDSFE